MPQKPTAWLCALALLASASCHAQRPDSRIDRIFAPWDKPGSPGCALAVVRDGATVYSRGYGSANLEHRIAITRATVFDIGSVSKQFTAMSIVLLAQDGKLSLDDEIHRTIPELPDYGAPVSLRQMLHHLSGLPSYTDLFDLAGVPETDLTTDADALTLIARQKSLNFPPGRQYLYSDTNYFLLALVVRRVSGRSLREFAQARIFAPLGMRDTHFHDDHAMIVPHRATGYAPRDGGGFAIDMSNYEELGDGSVMTTADDMVRWDRNFHDPVVGGSDAIELLQSTGLRNDGSASPYAMGLIRDRYRGHERVQHTGEWVGYRAGYLRFPQDRLSVILLCNLVGDIDTLGLAEQVADRYFGATPATAATANPATADLAANAGQYWNAQTFALLNFSARDGTLARVDGDSSEPLHDAGAGRFVAQDSSTRFVFRDSGGHRTVEAASDDGDPVVLDRVPDSKTGMAAQRADLAPYAGTYYSADLGVTWTLSVDAGRLVRSQWLFPPRSLRAQFGEVFSGDLSEGTYALQFTRDAAGTVEGFAVATSMVRPLQFRRCTPGDARSGGPIAVGCKAPLPPAGQP